MKQKSKQQLIDELTEAMFAFIQKNPPQGFNLPYFVICVMSGRVEEAIQALKDFNEPKKEVEK